MSERLPAASAAILLEDEIRPALLGFFDFVEGPVRLHTPGIGEIKWAGETWYGCGALAQIGDLEETTEGRAVSTELELTPLPLVYEHDGVDFDILRYVNRTNWHQRPARLYFGLFHATSLSWKVAPFQIRKGFMDVMEFSEAGDTARIKLTLESRFFDLERAEVLRYTAESQRHIYPDDAFFDQVAELQDKPINWNMR